VQRRGGLDQNDQCNNRQDFRRSAPTALTVVQAGIPVDHIAPVCVHDELPAIRSNAFQIGVLDFEAELSRPIAPDTEDRLDGGRPSQPRREMLGLQKPVATFGVRIIRNFQVDQFRPEASAIPVLMAGARRGKAAEPKRVPLPGTCVVAESENCFEFCCHSKQQINATETSCQRFDDSIVWRRTLSAFPSWGRRIGIYLLEDQGTLDCPGFTETAIADRPAP
jgi:hypothetical protein